MLPNRRPHQLLFKAGDKGTGAKLQGIVRTGAAVKGNTVQIAGKVDDCNIAQLCGPIHRLVYRILGLRRINGRLLFLLRQLHIGALHMDALILAQLDLGPQCKLHLEFQTVLFIGLKHGDHRLGSNGQSGLRNGLRIVLGEHILHRLPQKILGRRILNYILSCHLKILMHLCILRISLVQRLGQHLCREVHRNLCGSLFI